MERETKSGKPANPGSPGWMVCMCVYVTRRSLAEAHIADITTNPRLTLQRFVYSEDGFIACRADDNLVLGVHEQDSGHTVSVTLMNRQAEDIRQRWIIHDNGYQLRYFMAHQGRILTSVVGAVKKLVSAASTFHVAHVFLTMSSLSNSTNV